ncbi:MAG TPA: acetylornithine transaminase [Desulfobacteraceae bacterium]|nr:acetylornithine transaminase [Desulfobacteraceae bacterium]
MNEEKFMTKELADKYMFKTYGRFPLTLVEGYGCRVIDEFGNEYLDFVGGIAVCALGHSSPIVSDALLDQSRRLVHVSNLFYTKPQVELARFLVEHSFADRVFFCNSGAEANEAAIKLARRYTREVLKQPRYKIVTMNNSFHGRTMATLSATGQAKVQAGYDPLVQGFTFVPFNDLEALESAIDDEVCAVMVEPIQGEGGVVCPRPDYLKGVRKLCDDRQILLIFDEVQTGMGRTGKLFAHEHFGVHPDIMSIAKALGNGLPIGAMLGVERLAEAFGPGSHATTFGGTPLMTAAATAVAKAIVEEGWLEHCSEMGSHFKARLQDLARRHTCIREVRGIGLIVGVELDRPCASVVEACIDEGFLINCAHENVLRFVPPLVVGKEEIDSLCDALDGILGRTFNNQGESK